MSLQSLYGNLLTHELEVEQRQGNTKELKSKSVALLSTDRKSTGKSASTDNPRHAVFVDDSDDEETESDQFNVEHELKTMNDSLVLLKMRYKKFLRKLTNQGGASKSDGKKIFQEKDPKVRVVCYNCDKPGPFASNCI